MKIVTIGWRETLFYTTTMNVPDEWNENEIEDAFWSLDLSGEKPVDTDFARIDYIEESKNEAAI